MEREKAAAPAQYPFLEAGSGGVYVRLRVQPRASKDEFSGIHGKSLKVKLTAPPVEGEANSALIAFLSKALGIKKSSIKIASGERSRDKRVLVAGLTMKELQERFLKRLKTLV